MLFTAVVFFFCVSLFLLYDFWHKELISRELSGYSEVVAEEYTLSRNMRQTELEYTYTVDGTTYRSNTFSPYPALNKQAAWSTQVRALTTRTETARLMVFFDPDDPAKSSILRGWPREGRLGGVSLGGICLWAACLLLRHIVQKVPRYDLLFSSE